MDKYDKSMLKSVIVSIIIFISLIFLFISYFIVDFIFGFFGGSPWTNHSVGKKVDKYLESQYKDYDFTVIKTYKDFNTGQEFNDTEVYKDGKLLFTVMIQYIGDNNFDTTNLDYAIKNPEAYK